MTSPHYLNRHDAPLVLPRDHDRGPLAASPALTTTAGDAVLATLLRGRGFESRPVIALGRLLVSADPIRPPGGGSSLTGTGGGGTGRRHGDGTSGRWGQR